MPALGTTTMDIEKVLTLTSEEIAYIAGFFDGEGSVVIAYQTRSKTPCVYVSLYQQRPAVLHWIASYFSGKVIHSPTKSTFDWRIGGQTPVRCFLRLVRPYLRVKLLEVEEALALLERKEKYTIEEIDAARARMKEYKKLGVPLTVLNARKETV